MVRLDKITPGKGLTIKYKGLVDFSKLYKDLHTWLLDRKYMFQEKEHNDATKDKGREIGVRWESERIADDYAKYIITVRISASEMQKMEKLDYANISIEIEGTVALDYSNKWQAKSFNNFLFKLYNKFVIKKKIGIYYSNLYKEVTEFYNTAKSILDMYS